MTTTEALRASLLARIDACFSGGRCDLHAYAALMLELEELEQEADAL